MIPLMSDATATPEVKAHPSLFTRLRVVEAELHTLKALFADLKEDHEALREDRDEWRWRAEYLLAEVQKRFFGRWGQRIEAAVKPLARRHVVEVAKTQHDLRLEGFRQTFQ